MAQMSVVVPVFNSQETFEECLRAIRRSTFQGYELIVVDDGSGNDISRIAQKYADRVIRHGINRGLAKARESGIRASSGDIAVFIDADILIQPDSLKCIGDYFAAHPGIEAATGMLAKAHPYADFFSVYKNLYMHYVFSHLPAEVTFLYGSIFAIRRTCFSLLSFDMEFAGEDLCLAHQLMAQKKHIGFVRGLEVVHVRHFSFRSFIRNEFDIPYSWARILIERHGWNQLFRKTGFAHASKKQLISVIIAPAIVFLGLCLLWGKGAGVAFISLSIVWLGLNMDFLIFLFKEQGGRFSLCSMGATFLDHCIKSVAIIAGFSTMITSRVSKRLKGFFYGRGRK